MNLSDALDCPSGNNQPSAGGAWPGQPTHPSWPGQPPNPTPPQGGMWPTDPSAPRWPGSGPTPGPSGPGWPAPGPAPSPSGPGWPSPAPAPNPPGPGWPGPAPAPSPSGPGWPGPAPAPSPSGPGWPSPVPAPNPSGPGWPSPAPQQILSIPYTHNLPSGVDKVSITITGTIKPNPDKITVDLSAGHDLAFHFNPRFNESGRQVIVRNSCINGQWGAEERELRHFPFHPGQPFELKIDCTNRQFKVAVNKADLLTYQHRITNLRSINTLSIYNDLSLSNVDVKYH